MPDLDPAIKAEIAEARRIIREDKLIASHKEIRDRFDKHFPADDGNDSSNPDPAANPNQPPAPEPQDPPEPEPDRKSRWWGDALDGA
jgi:hypothetical protein